MSLVEFAPDRVREILDEGKIKNPATWRSCAESWRFSRLRKDVNRCDGRKWPRSPTHD